MSIVRIARKQSHYTMIMNSTLQDATISVEARGVLVYLLSMPDDWTVHQTQIRTMLNVGKDKMQRIFNELIEAGYIEEEFDREAGRYKGVNYIVYESPWNVALVPVTAAGKTGAGKTGAGKTGAGKPVPTNEPSNKGITNTKDTSSREIEKTETQILCEELQGLLAFNEIVAFKETNAQVGAMKKLITEFGVDEVRSVMVWAHNDDFWFQNIYSPVQLKKHYPALKVRMNKPKKVEQQNIDRIKEILGE